MRRPGPHAFAVFGYVTATIATFFAERDAESDDSEVASAASIAHVKAEIIAPLGSRSIIQAEGSLMDDSAVDQKCRERVGSWSSEGVGL